MSESEWESKKTPDSNRVEKALRSHFDRVDAYRFNSASIRVRVIDKRFEGMPVSEREDLVMPVLDKLPKKIREDILMVVLLAPSEQTTPNRQSLINLEFEEPSRSLL